MIDCDELMEWKVLRKVVNRKKRVKRERQGGKRCEKTFHKLACASLRRYIRVTTTAFKRMHLSHQV